MRQAWRNLQYDYSPEVRTDKYSPNPWFHKVVQQIKNRQNRGITISIAILIVTVIVIVSGDLLNSIDLHNKIQNKNLNIRDLQETLQQQQWENSDKLTRRLFYGDLALTCLDLSTINKLWLKNSDGKFGLTVQKYIWESSLDGVMKNKGLSSVFQNDNEKALAKFGDVVGWRNPNEDRWLRYYEYNFSAPLQQFPQGYLPISWGNIDDKVWNLIGLSNDLNKCNIR